MSSIAWSRRGAAICFSIASALLVACGVNREDPRETVYEFAHAVAEGDTTTVCSLTTGAVYDTLQQNRYCDSNPAISRGNGIRLIGACEITQGSTYLYWFEADQSFAGYFNAQSTTSPMEYMKAELGKRGDRYFISELYFYERTAGILDMAATQDITYAGENCGRGLNADVA